MKVSFIFYEPVPTLSELDRRMGRLAALRYQGIELTACHPAPYASGDVAALARKHQLPVVSFLSGWSYGNEVCAWPVPCLRFGTRAVERLVEYASYAASLTRCW